MGGSDQMALAQSNNIIEEIKNLRLEVEELKRRLTNVQVDSLDEMTSDLGQIGSGQLVFGNGNEIGDGFSGVWFGYPGLIINEEEWNLAGINNDVLQVGISAIDGKLYTAGGMLIADQNALTMEGLLYALVHNATYGGVTRTMRYGMFLPAGSTTPAGIISFESPAGTNLLSNPGFEDGDFTSWTTAGAGTWSVGTDTPTPQEGTYCAKLTATEAQTADHTLTSDAFDVTGDTVYLVSLYSYFESNLWSTQHDLEVKWYDAVSGGGSLVRTDTVQINYQADTWAQTIAQYTSPPGALSAKIVVTLQRGSGNNDPGLALDNFSFSAISVGKAIYFAPDITLTGGICLTHLAAAQTAPPAGQTGLSFRDTGGYLIGSDGVKKELAPDGSYKRLSVFNTTTETTIFSHVFKGGVLGIYGRFSVHTSFLVNNSTGSTRNVTVKVKAGATELLVKAVAFTTATAGYRGGMYIDVDWANTGLEGATSQAMRISWNSGPVDANTAGNIGGDQTIHNFAAIDTSDDWTFSITVTLAVASADLYVHTTGAQLLGPYYHE